MRIRALVLLMLQDPSAYELTRFHSKSDLVNEIDRQLETMISLKELLEADLSDPPDPSNVIPIRKRT